MWREPYPLDPGVTSRRITDLDLYNGVVRWISDLVDSVTGEQIMPNDVTDGSNDPLDPAKFRRSRRLRIVSGRLTALSPYDIFRFTCPRGGTLYSIAGFGCEDGVLTITNNLGATPFTDTIEKVRYRFELGDAINTAATYYQVRLTAPGSPTPQNRHCTFNLVFSQSL